LFQGVPFFFEEGRYSDTGSFEFPSVMGSVKYIDIDFGAPELLLASSTNFDGISKTLS
jgi:hypothetical protein